MAQINFNKSAGANYELIFPVLPVTKRVGDADIFTLNIHSTIVPAITLATAEVDWQGGRLPMAISPLVYEPWYVNFSIDSNWCNWWMLYRWITFIDDGYKKYGEAMPNYFVDAMVNIYDNMDNRIMGLKIINIYPTSLNEVTLSQRDDQVNLSCGVNFNYTRIEVERVYTDN